VEWSTFTHAAADYKLAIQQTASLRYSGHEWAMRQIENRRYVETPLPAVSLEKILPVYESQSVPP
jgi:hypothetical protein